ncbi:hypothetical protein RB195_008788 [Necator americanus]|uniref:tRNA dimethylallyltransferase n=1 Tax=Necator americanus TaxID=51031 RepID=A0ABR1CQB4_NECAM
MSGAKTEVIRKNPVIFVIGCTGTGKSDLGVAIAKKYKGEVISADSMQIYKGLDIATNKITEEEADGIPHHLMSFVDAATAKYNIHQFRQQGLEAIEEIRQRGCTPVIVGGTAYYVESLLFEENIIETPESSNNVKELENLESLSNSELHRRLEEIDPQSARLVHPNNRTRVLRAIEVFKLTGKRKSEFLREQKESNGSRDLGGRLRFPESLVLSLDASKEVLIERLNVRVEKMKKLGLRKELEEYYDKNREKLINRDHFGVLQCIGLKEFIPYLELSSEERLSGKGERLFEKGCEDVKLHTRQYARRQRNWVNSRFVRRQEIREVPSLKVLDTSDKNTFIADGMRIVDEWMSGRDFKESNDNEGENSEDANMTRRCEVCGIIVAGTRNWNKHLAGKRHKNAVRALKRHQQMLNGTENVNRESSISDSADESDDSRKNVEVADGNASKRPTSEKDEATLNRELENIPYQKSVNRTIESYIEENVEIIFYDRFYTYEVMAGTYLVKNSDWSRNFLDGWANYEYRLPRSFHGSDNGVLNIYLVEWIAPSRHIELNLCQQIWNNSRNWNGVFTFTACVRDILGDQTNYGKIKILKKGTGWARDSFLTNGRWNPSRDFMLHDMKAKYRRYRKPLSLASPLRTLEMHLWYNPFVGEFDLNLCKPGNSSWNYVSYLIAPVSALEERYRKKYLEVHFEKLRTLGGIREFFGNSEFERTLSEPWNNGVRL